MLLQNSPLRDFDTLFEQLTGRSTGAVRPMPMDAYRRGDNVWVHIDLPGVAASSIDVSIERNVLTVTAERAVHRADDDRVYLTERASGTYRRQVSLGDGLDGEHIEADYQDGVLTLRLPVVPQAKPRKITVGSGTASLDATSSDAGAATTDA